MASGSTEELLKLLKHEDRYIREDAAGTLTKIILNTSSDLQFDRILQKLLDESDDPVIGNELKKITEGMKICITEKSNLAFTIDLILKSRNCPFNLRKSFYNEVLKSHPQTINTITFTPMFSVFPGFTLHFYWALLIKSVKMFDDRHIVLELPGRRNSKIEARSLNKDREFELEEHLWFSHEWRQIITLLGGFYNGSPGCNDIIRGPIDRDITYKPLSILDMILNDNENPDDIFHTMLLLGSEYMGELNSETRKTKKFKRIEREFIRKILNLIRNEKESFYSNVREAISLCRLENEELLESLVMLLKNDNRQIRERATEALGHIGSLNSDFAEKSVCSMLDSLTEEDYFIRLKTASAIDKICSCYQKMSGKVTEKLLEMLMDINRKTQQQGIEALSRIGNTSKEVAETITNIALNPLLEMLSDKNSSVNGVIVDALLQISYLTPESAESIVIPMIMKWKNNKRADKSNEKSDETSTITGSMKNKTESVIKTKSSVSQSISAGITIDSIIKIGKTTSKAAVQALKTLIADLENQPPKSKQKILYALGEITVAVKEPSSQIIDSVIDTTVCRLNDKNWYIRREAARSLGKIGSLSRYAAQKVITPLVDCFKNGSPDIRIDAAASVNRINMEFGGGI